MDKFFDCDVEQKIDSVLIIDFMNLVFRTLNFSQKNNPLDLEYLDWKADMVVCLFSYILKFEPSRVVIAMDSRNSWRKSFYPEYKSKRADARDASIIDYDKFFSEPYFPKFVNDLKETFKSLVFLDIETAEADDIVAVLTKKYSTSGTKIICVSNDGDLNQLVKFKNYSQYNPIKKTMVEIFDPVIFLNAKILFGDLSDNIPHVCKGMGKVTSEKQASRLSDYLEESSEEIRNNFKRNKMLIDLDLIPQDIVENIKSSYDKYVVEKTNGFTMYNFFLSNKLTRMVEDSQKYLFKLNKLV